jgi:GMP reductase
MRLENELKLDFDDVLIKPKRSKLKSRKDVDLTKTYKFLHSKKTWTGIPIMASNMDTVGVFPMSDALQKYQMITVINKFYTVKHWLEHKEIDHNLTIPSIGTSNEELKKFDTIYNKLTTKPEFLCIDVANGYGEYLIEFVKKVRAMYPNITLISGNVVSGEMTEQLILSGVDIVKVGIGPGSACTTRLKTGCGCPQLSAVIDCADAAHGLGGLVISDGGCRTPGDIAKAFAAGADFVMLGGMLAGHEESAGDYIEEKYQTNQLDENDKPIIITKKFKLFYGMSSDTAQNKHYGNQKSYRASEGRTAKVPFKGSVHNTIQEILGGLRSTCTYVGASCLKHLPKCTTFMRVNNTHNRSFLKYEV